MRLTKKHKESIQAIREGAEENRFLHQWLKNSHEARRVNAEDEGNILAPERERICLSMGYRSLRSATAHWEHTHMILQRFISEPAFQRLWEILKKYDQKYNDFSFSAANGGFPSRLLTTVEYWHKTPKFTGAERKRHSKKIQSACDELRRLLEQVAFTSEIDVSFSQFYDLEQDDVDGLLYSFKTSKSAKLKEEWDRKNFARWALKNAGITPIWAVEKIRQSASLNRSGVNLPRKIRAKGALKTFMIKRLWHDLSMALMMGKIEDLVSNELFSEIVALVSNDDCTADDVRKALREDAEDSALQT